MPNRSRATRSCTRGSRSIAVASRSSESTTWMQPPHQVPLGRLLTPEREQVGRPILTALHREVEREGQRRERGPAGSAHSG
jgi:hypothetical protein